MKHIRPTIFYFFCSAIITLLFSDVSAQQFNRNKFYTPKLFSISQCVAGPDGSIITCGYYYYDTHSGFVIKFDSTGEMLWSKEITTPNVDTLEFSSVVVNSDGSILICGTQSHTNYRHVILIACLDTEGNIRWGRRYNFLTECTGDYICKASDGGYIIAGQAKYTSSKGAYTSNVTFKIDSVGKVLWGKKISYSQATEVVLYRIRELKDGSLAIVGYFAVPPPPANPQLNLFMALVHLTEAGEYVSQKIMYTPRSEMSSEGVLEYENGDLIVYGIGLIGGGMVSPALIRVTAMGDIAWAKGYNFFSQDALRNISITSNSTVLGFAQSLDPSQGGTHTFEVDPQSGEMRTVVSFEDRLTNDAQFIPNATSDKRYTLIARRRALNNVQSHIDVTVFPESLQGCNSENTIGITSDIPVKDTILDIKTDAIVVPEFSQTVIATTSLFNRLFVCSTFIDTNALEVADKSSGYKKTIALYPNPVLANSSISLSLPNIEGVSYNVILRDLTGREVYRTHREAAAAGEQIQIPTTGLASGVYTVELVDANSFANVWRGKVVIE